MPTRTVPEATTEVTSDFHAIALHFQPVVTANTSAFPRQQPMPAIYRNRLYSQKLIQPTSRTRSGAAFFRLSSACRDANGKTIAKVGTWMKPDYKEIYQASCWCAPTQVTRRPAKLLRPMKSGLRQQACQDERYFTEVSVNET